MSKFDTFSRKNFVHQEQMKQLEQLKKQDIKKIEQDKQELNTTPQQAEAQEASTATPATPQMADVSVLEVLANQNKGLINIAGRSGISSGNYAIIDKSELIDKQDAHMNTDVVPGSTGGTEGTTPAEPTTNETTISNEELYANREKFTQEFVDSLNIGLNAETFSNVINTHFQKVTINGEEVYILRSGTLTQVKDLISQIYVTDKLATTPDYTPKPITLDDILQHFGVTESDLQVLMQKLGATDLADFVSKLKNADINELTYQSSNEPISIESLMQDFGVARMEIELLMSEFGATDLDDFISKLKALPMDIIEDMVTSHPEKYPKSGVEEVMSLVTYLRARSDVFFESNVQDIKDLLSYIQAPSAFDPLEANGGYALTSQQKFEERKANYYYMCYLNGIPYTGHEFEDGTYNKEIARQCGLYGYENVFEDYLNNENVQQYLLENFGITVSTPLSEEYKELWDKLANLAAIGEDGKNTGEYNVYNVLKYFGLAVTDSSFMAYINKATYVQDDNSITNNTWDIEAVKSVISERYPELLENSEVLTDEFLTWIGSNAFEFLLMNQSKLRANGLQDFVNYGNIPSWITYNTGTEFNEELLLKCCIQSMAKLAEMGYELGYDDPKKFVNIKIADYVTKMYNSELENIESTHSTGGPNLAPRQAQPEWEIPDYVLNFLWSKFGHDVSFRPSDIGDVYYVYIDNKQYGFVDYFCGDYCYYPQDDIIDGFVKTTAYNFENGKPVPSNYVDTDAFYNLYSQYSQLPESEQSPFIDNIVSDLYGMFSNLDFVQTASIMSFLMNPRMNAYGDISSITENEADFFDDIRAAIFPYYPFRPEQEHCSSLYDYLYDTIALKMQELGYTDLYGLLPSKEKPCDISSLYFWTLNRMNNDSGVFKWNPDGVLIGGKIVEQGSTGDCWLISSLISMAQHPEISDALKDYCFSYDKTTKTYSVIFQGETYSFTKDQIIGATELSNGDVETRVLEMALREHFGITSDSNPIASGGYLKFLVSAFTDTDITNDYDFGEDMNTILANIKSGEFASQLSTASGFEFTAINSKTGKTVKLVANHAYSVVGADNKYIYIINPWDSSTILKLPIETIKNNPDAFDYSDVKVAKLVQAIKANTVPQEIKDKLDNGSYFTESGDFDYNQYYNDCIEFGMNSSNLEFMFDKSADGIKLSIFNPDGTVTIVTKGPDGKIQNIEIGRPMVSFESPDGLPFNIDNFTDEELIDRLSKSVADISIFIMPDGKIDRDLLSSMLPKFTVGGWFDSSALQILMHYYKTEDGFDSEGFKQLLSNFNNYDDVERFAKSVLKYEKVQAAMMSNNAQAAIYALQSWAEERIAKLKNSGSIYNEMDYWQWVDALVAPNGTAESYIQAINAMNSIINAAKSIGVSLDAYIHMDPAERERRRGMLTAPMNDEILIEPWNIVPVDENDGEEGVGMYYSTPNQSSCYSAPEWFVEAYLNGEIPDDEIGIHVINGTNTEAEETLYFERQHYQIWQTMNSSLLIGLPPIEQYSLYMMDMMYFSMWLNTDCIVQGYTKDDDWETLYEAYHQSGSLF